MNGTNRRVARRRPRSWGLRGPSHRGALRWMGGPAAAGAGIALLAACGGGSHPAGPGASPAPNPAVVVNAYAQCLRTHGVPNVYVSGAAGSANPGATVMIFRGFAIEGANPALPQVQAAMHACQHVLPQNTRPPAAELHQQFLKALRSARCMRAHGYPNWPDARVVNGQVAIPFPAAGTGIDTNSPQFQAAAKTCGEPGSVPLG